MIEVILNLTFGCLVLLLCFLLLLLLTLLNRLLFPSTIFDNETCWLSFVYASTSYIRRRDLWDSLIVIHNNVDGPWMVIGDFTAVLGMHEKSGGVAPLSSSCMDFQAMSDTCQLVHVDTTGHPYTWNNGWRSRGFVQLRLDRSLCNPFWFNKWPVTNCLTLPRLASDHNPLLFTADKSNTTGPSPFRFKSMWIQHPDFMKVVSSSWNSSKFYGCPVFTQKLKALKGALRDWNRQHFGNIHENVRIAKDQLS